MTDVAGIGGLTMTNKADFVTEVTVHDTVDDCYVGVAIYRDRVSGAMFGVDASYIADADPAGVHVPFRDEVIELIGD